MADINLNDSKADFLILRPGDQSAHLSKIPVPLILASAKCHWPCQQGTLGYDKTMSVDKQVYKSAISNPSFWQYPQHQEIPGQRCT